MATEEKGLVKYEARDGQHVTLSYDTIKHYLVQGRSELVTKQEMLYFMGICKSRGLNPFVKDCYLIKYSSNEGAAIITSIDYFRKRAKAQRDCKGWEKGIIVERNNEVIYTSGLILDSDKLLGGWFKAQPKGWDKPFSLEVNLRGYIKRKKDGTITKFWAAENQPTQISKVAESQGLRTLWPDEFQQLYTPEEIDESNMFKQTEQKISNDIPETREPGTAEKLYGSNTPQNDAEGPNEADVETLFEKRTNIPLKVFKKYRTTGLKHFADHFRGEYRNWEPKVVEAIEKKFKETRDHPEWAELLEPKQPVEDRLPELKPEDVIICPEGGRSAGDEMLPEHCQETCEIAKDGNCQPFSEWEMAQA